VSTSFEPNDELCRLWQTPGRTATESELEEIMQQVEKRAKKMEGRVHARNIREYVAGALGAVVFGLLSWKGRGLAEQVGYGIVSASAVWVVFFLWWMQRSTEEALPEFSGEVYKRTVLDKYDRQILLTRTAWAWYVLPPITGLLVSSLGHDYASKFHLVMAGLLIAVGAGIAELNRRAAKALATEKRDLERLLEAAE
jgi:hypothetical protein